MGNSIPFNRLVPHIPKVEIVNNLTHGSILFPPLKKSLLKGKQSTPDNSNFMGDRKKFELSRVNYIEHDLNGKLLR